MPRTVQREELLDYQTYSDTRADTRPLAMQTKGVRRIHAGGVLTFLFENADTTRYQIQEMMLVECMAREKDILHELKTYNAMIGDTGELGCTLLIEIDDETLRAEKLQQWLSLPDTLYIRCSDNTVVRAQYDRMQVGEQRVSSVQYLKFAVGERDIVSLGCDFDDVMLKHETTLSEEQREALQTDLRASLT